MASKKGSIDKHHQETHKPFRLNKKVLIWSFSIIAVVVVLVWILNTIQVSYVVDVPYNDREPYTYQDCKDTNIKSVIEFGQTDTVCLNEICDQNQQVCTATNWYGGCTNYVDQCIHYACTKYRADCHLNIENIDDTAGSWTVSAYYVNNDLKQDYFVDNVNVFIQPTKTGIATWSYTFDAGANTNCKYYSVTGPTKQVCSNAINYRDVQKTKQEIRYCSQWDKMFNGCGQ